MTKVNIVSGSSTTTYYLNQFPQLGDVINWGFAGIVGKVTSVVWQHTNEVTLTLNNS